MKLRLGICLALFVFLVGVSAAAEPPYAKQTFTYKTVGSMAIKADVYRPPGEGLRPIIVWIHPGGLIMGSRAMLLLDECERFLRAGFIVVAIDYRLAPETKLPEILADIADAFKWVRGAGATLFDGDPKRVVAVGSSAGGYLALMAGARVQPRLNAIVSFYGYGDIGGEWYNRPSPFYATLPRVSHQDAHRAIGVKEISEAPVRERNAFYIYCRQNGSWPYEVVGPLPNAGPAPYAAFSVERLVTKDFPPTLLLHGDQDVDVPFEMSERMAAKLAEHRVEHRFIRMEGFNHAFDVFPSYPPEGPPVGLSRPKVAEAFEGVVSFLVKHSHKQSCSMWFTRKN
ncbi:MAG: alpha/beta hydrolase [Nibricoccus sp.]